jgi:hypothetical protein
LQPFWWRDNCAPYETGANSGKLQIIRTCRDALQHVEIYCADKKADQVLAIKYLAPGKGMPEASAARRRRDSA